MVKSVPPPERTPATTAVAPTPLRSMSLALRLVELVAEAQPIGASDVARLIDEPKATIHRNLLALEAAGWLERDGGTRPRWSVTMRPIALGGRAIERKSGLRIAALSIMDALRRTTGETVHLGLLDGDKIVLIERIDGLASVGIFLPVGTSWALHWSSAGKTLLAHLPEEQQRAYLDQPLLRRKSTDEVLPPAELANELAEIRKRGFALSVGGLPASSSSIGAPVFNRLGIAVAGLSISGASERLSEEKLIALAPAILDAARSISVGLALE